MVVDEPFVIVGAGLAGAKAAQSLRENGFDGRVVLIGNETQPPYERPPLSKDYLLGTADLDTAFVHPRQWYVDHNVDLRLGVEVTRIDPTSRLVHLADGNGSVYSKLLLTTGSSSRRLSILGAAHDRVHYLRTMSDSVQIKSILGYASKLVVIGAGWIGLETAAAARAAGLEVTVLEMAKLPLIRVLGPEVAEIFADLHRQHGVDLRCDVNITEITGDNGQANGVRLSDGTRIEADAVIVGAGITPNISVAEAAGLTINNGIRVDQHLRTSVDDIYAAGDVANAFHPVLGRHIRVEHWANALHQSQIAARSMLGENVAYDRLPYFFTDQYEMSMEYTGYVEPGEYDQVAFRGDIGSGQYIAFWLGSGRVLAGMNVNTWDVTEQIQALIETRTIVNPARLADPRIPMESLIVS